MATEVELERLIVRIIGDGSSYQRMVKTAVDSTGKAAKKLAQGSEQAQVFGKALGDLGSKMSNFAGQMMAMAALQSPLSFLYDSVRKAAESEALETSFGTMLRSAEKGKQLVKDIQTMAAATPMSQIDLSRTAQMLLQFKVASGELIPTMRQLGDVANGDAEKLQRLSRAFGQMRGTGRVTNEELGQMREAGFYPLEEIAKKTGISITILRDEIAKGKVPFSVFTEVLREATSEGGQFYNGMENASKTLSGLFSTMKDDIDAVKRVFGEYIIESFRLKDVLKEVSANAQALAEWFKNLDPEMKRAIAATALLVASFMSLVVVWKVVSIMGGIIIGTTANMILTVRSLIFYVNVLNFSFSGLMKALKSAKVLMLSWAPELAVLVAISVIVGMVVDELGGFEAAFEYVKQAAKDALEWIERKFDEFSEWIKPVTDALESLGTTAWAEFKANAHAAWEGIKEIVAASVAWIEQKWIEMGGDAVPTWEEIRETAQRAILFIEYSLTHLGEVSNLAWAGIKLYAVKALNFILEHIPFVFAAPPILAAMVLFQVNWKNVFNWIWDTFVKVVSKIGDLWAKVFTSMTRMLLEFLADPTKGVSFNWGDIIGENKDFFADFKLQGLPGLLDTKELEQDLQKEFDAIKGGVFANFEEFYKKKMEEFANFQPKGKNGRWGIWDQLFKPMLDGAEKTTDGVKSLTKEIQKFDSVLFGSAESNARIRAFKDMVGATKRATGIDTSARLQTVQYPGWEIGNQLSGGATGQATDILNRPMTLDEKAWQWLAEDASKDTFGDFRNRQRGAGKNINDVAGKTSQDAMGNALLSSLKHGNIRLPDSDVTGTTSQEALNNALLSVLKELNIRLQTDSNKDTVKILPADLE